MDVSKARDAFARTCTGPVYSIDGCAWLVRAIRAQRRDDDGAAAETNAAKIGCSVLGATADNRELRADSCVAYGQALRASHDDGGALRAFRDACELGDRRACDAVKKLEPENDAPKVAEKPKVASDVDGANLNMTSMNVDGLLLRDISCRTEGGGIGGLFGGIALGAGFKARRAQLDACSPKETVETRVKWTGAGGRMTSVKATGKDPAVNKCVERALTGAVATIAGACAASVTHGRK